MLRYSSETLHLCCCSIARLPRSPTDLQQQVARFERGGCLGRLKGFKHECGGLLEEQISTLKSLQNGPATHSVPYTHGEEDARETGRRGVQGRALSTS